tara:strand:- start:5602 stop:6450 length:849 start_codon:yes stop_codon:yes gene_type:complete
MYANAYSLSKKINYNLLIDSISAYKKIKITHFLLDKFNIKLNYATKNDIQDNFFKYVKHKIEKKTDIFRKKKKFLIEKKYLHKSTKFNNLLTENLGSKVFLEGHFESEKYFKEYKKDIIEQFKIKQIDKSSLFLDPNILRNANSVSIAIRQNRFSEKKTDNYSKIKSDNFVNDTLNYVLQGMHFFKKKITNPKFFIFSNNTKGLNQFFENFNDCTIVNHNNNKIINDFYLSSLCKNFIVGPTTFHWWTAYLSNYKNKICICPPKSLKFSSNSDIFPSNWFKI